jgi:hypothetical protein
MNMQIWFDDLGIQDDTAEICVLLTHPYKAFSEFSRVTSGDTAVASLGESGYSFRFCDDYFRTIHLLMLAGF